MYLPVIDTAAFDYDLPQASIAQTPVEPRHAARLLDTRKMQDHRFLDLPGLLRAGDLVVVNRTRVRHARLHGEKATGGRVETLLLRRVGDAWLALVKPARRLRPGTQIRFGEIEAEILDDPVEGMTRMSLRCAGGDLEAAIQRQGLPPLPPYIHGPLRDPQRYQTLFADVVGSAAAPTAGLHFTAEVVEGLAAGGIEIAPVELDVGLATFRPITAPDIGDHVMHAERCRIPESTAAAVEACRDRGGRVVAIGTTVVRTLESFAHADGIVGWGEMETELYLAPGSAVSVVDLLVTNFHLPRSSLLVLVEAFMGAEWREAYRHALRSGYRFLSFGDAMLCRRMDAS